MIVGISRVLLDQIVGFAAELPGEEVCGLLFGDAGVITDARPARNIVPDRTSRFEIDPAALIAAHRAARGGGPRPIGNFHSHPNGAATPSARDAADAEPGSLWMIVAAGEVRLFVAATDGPIHGRFRPVELRVAQERVAHRRAQRHKGL